VGTGVGGGDVPVGDGEGDGDFDFFLCGGVKISGRLKYGYCGG
jgi:hypothetical protein